MTLTIRNRLASAILLLGALAGGCGDDDDDDAPIDGGNVMDAAMGGDAGTSTFTGKVVVSTDITMTLPGKMVWLFDVNTGMRVGNPQTSGADGRVTFTNRTGMLGVFVLGGGEHQDTLNYPPSRVGEEELIRQGTRGAAFAVPAPNLANYTASQDASPVAGSVLWKNPATGKDEYVGCAVLEETATVKDVRYFTGALPTSVMNRSSTRRPMGDPAQPSNETEAGKFFAGNVSGGLQTLNIKINGATVGTRQIFIVPRSAGTPISPMAGQPGVPSNLTLASIWVQGATNPTPANCQ